MFIEERKQKSGTISYRYGETYKDPLTLKYKKVYITSSKNGKAVRKEMQRLLDEKIQSILCASDNKKHMTIGQLIDEFADSERGIRKVTTQRNIDNYASVIKKWFNGDIVISQMKAIHIQQVINEKLTELSWSYVKAVYGYVRQSFKYAKRMGYISNIDLFDDIVLRKPTKTPEQLQAIKDKFLTKQELDELLDKVEKKNDRAAKVFKFLSLTGLRIGELRALRVQDYNAKEMCIEINATLSQKNERLAPKNEYSFRKVTIGKAAKEILSYFIQLNYTRQQIMKGYNNPNQYIFVTDGGQPYDIQFLNKLLKNIPFHKHVSTHTFRHTHISLLAEANIPLKTIMERVGHNEPKTTLSTYTHVTDEMKQQEKEFLDTLSV